MTEDKWRCLVTTSVTNSWTVQNKPKNTCGILRQVFTVQDHPHSQQHRITLLIITAQTFPSLNCFLIRRILSLGSEFRMNVNCINITATCNL